MLQLGSEYLMNSTFICAELFEKISLIKKLYHCVYSVYSFEITFN